MPIQQTYKYLQSRVPVKVWTTDIEDGAKNQLMNMSTLPFIHKHIAVMPDVHHGKGSTVGSVVPTIKAIIPAAVGVDIGCGMIALKLDLKANQLPDSLRELRLAIEHNVPHGRTDNGGSNDRGAWNSPPLEVKISWELMATDPKLAYIHERFPKLFARPHSAHRQLGTLGGGNHFIEVCLDEQDGVWLMLHSGSRGIGNKIGSFFIDAAKEEMERWHINLPDPDLAFLPEGTPLFEGYWKGVLWAQEYALQNRRLMMRATRDALEDTLGFTIAPLAEAVECHHNYVMLESHFGRNVYVTRKGAVRAREGDLGIIPGSMGARSFIVSGKGNPESFHSCSHGAGRRMSRTQAEKTFTLEDVEKQTFGIECRKDAGVIDEIPSAYKSIHEVMENQSDLVDIVATLRQVVCVKG